MILKLSLLGIAVDLRLWGKIRRIKSGTRSQRPDVRDQGPDGRDG